MAALVPAARNGKLPGWITGERVLLDYGEAAEPWHERLLLRKVAANDWVVLTPDMDVYVEEIAVPPLGGVRHIAVDGALPFGLGAAYGQPTYRFVNFPTAAAFLLIEAEAEQIARLAIASDAGRYAVALAVLPSPAAAPPACGSLPLRLLLRGLLG